MCFQPHELCTNDVRTYCTLIIGADISCTLLLFYLHLDGSLQIQSQLKQMRKGKQKEICNLQLILDV